VAAQGRGEFVTAAEALVSELTAQGVEVIFLNPGTDTAPIQEAVAALHAAGKPVPQVALCPHEAVALAAAHAYFAVTGRPQVVLVHVDVGTQNLGSMLHNAFRGEAGVLVIAGRTPITAYGELPGGRDHVVHWQQDVPDQAGIVRAYVKWAGDIERPETLTGRIGRAFQVARAIPNGPVYLTVGREMLMSEMPSGTARRDVRRLGVPAPMAPDPAALAEAAAILAACRRPVLLTTRLGRNPRAMAELVELAETVGAAVIDRRERVNFPSTHPAYLGAPEDAAPALESADAVVVVDSMVPWVPLQSIPSPNATIITIDADPVKASIPGWSFPSDITLQADPALALRALNDSLQHIERAGPTQPWWQPPRSRSAHRDTETEPGAPLAPAVAVQALDEVLAADDIVIEEATTNAEVLRGGLRRTVPGTLFHPGGSGLGWGLGAATGAKLAAPDRRVVAVVGDGSFVFGSPTAALWAAKAVGAPFLAVVLSNGGYAASRRPVFELFPDGFSAAASDVVGTRFDDPPGFARLAQACGAVGETVTRRDDLIPMLKRGLAAVESGSCAVVVLPVSSPWFPQEADG
jgi:acetolactate synthase-1/2/3 large subunit